MLDPKEIGGMDNVDPGSLSSRLRSELGRTHDGCQRLCQRGVLPFVAHVPPSMELIHPH